LKKTEIKSKKAFMKNNLGTFVLASRRSAGAVLLALCAFAPISRADVIIDNTGQTTLGFVVTSFPQAQVFTMSGTSGNISSLTLLLNAGSAGTANVDLYSVSGSAPNSFISTIGTIDSAASGSVAVSLSGNPLLSSSTSYAVVLEPGNGSSWNYTTTSANAGDGSVGSLYYFNGGTWNVEIGQYVQMNLQTTPVPEIPITGAVMGFGALAIAFGRTLRRSFHPTV
jgi:hypothetical protein